ncbi:MAG: glycosyltransferase family 2 protein [Candidatus Promineifilaceae bacterium]|nr:glycosyltransferase family 2 protein [Candidatus Promineifilaceae bacterium]
MDKHLPSVSVIIVNWNGRRWLQTCLPYLQEQTYDNVELVVVDNGSNDGSVDWLATHWPHIRVLALEHNTGFAKANNEGIRVSQGDYVVTLNNDTRVTATWLTELVKGVSAADVGMVAACIMQWQDPARLDSAGIEVDRAGIAWQRGWNQPVSSTTVASEVFGPSAAAALYRRAMLDQIGLFDEDFFAYYEDVDLAWRAQQAGWRCRYAPEAKVFHWHSGTAAAIPARKLYLTSRNRIWTLLKNYPSTSLWSSLAAMLLYETMGLGYQLARTRNTVGLRGRLDAIRHRQIPLAKRPSPVMPVPLSPLTPPWRLSGRIRKADIRSHPVS